MRDRVIDINIRKIW